MATLEGEQRRIHDGKSLMIPQTDPVKTVKASGSAWRAELITFTLVSGQVLRFTTADIDITWDGNTWLSAGANKAPLIERGEINFVAGLEVDQLELTVTADETMSVLGLSWPHALRSGLFDGAEVSLSRAVGPLGGAIVGVTPRFTGKVGPCTIGRYQSTITVDSLLAYLRAPVPRNVYQASCANTIYDSSCGLNRAAREIVATIQAVSADGLTVTLTGNVQAGMYAAGFARFGGSGSNAGQQVTIRDNSANVLTLLYQFPATLAVGDQLALAPGCQKTRDACNGYGNIVRFRGHPHVPVPETML